MRLDRDTLALQLPQIIPITDGFFWLVSGVKAVEPSDVVGRDEENGRIPELEQPGKCDGAHRSVSVIEGEQGRPLGQALGGRDTPEEGQEVDHLPALFAEVAQVADKDPFWYVEPRLPTTRGWWLADLVVAEDREVPVAHLVTHAGTSGLHAPNAALSCQRPLQHTSNDFLSIKVLLCQFAGQPAM